MQVMNTWTLIRTTWGWFGFVSRRDRLVATYLPGEKDAVLARIRQEWGTIAENRSALPSFQRDIRAYFKGRDVAFDVKIDATDVSDFRRRVIRACRGIRYGRTTTYGELARRVGQPGASRAVGTIMARNRLPIIVPCHRVVRADGSLGGFSSPGGLTDKQRLLEMERGASAAARGHRTSGRFRSRHLAALPRHVRLSVKGG